MILYEPGVVLDGYYTVCKHNGFLIQIAESYDGHALLQGNTRTSMSKLYPGLFQGECQLDLGHIKLLEKITTGPKYEVWSVSPTTGEPKPYGYIILLSNHYDGI